jgi:hypothetical protein
MLQWSRGSSTAEIRVQTIDNRLPRIVASMEPRFFNRGNQERERRIEQAEAASMEPRFS